MADYTLNINGKSTAVQNVDPETPLLWILRDHLGLAGTKFGCGIAQCGACTVHMNGAPARSCVTPVDAVSDARGDYNRKFGRRRYASPLAAGVD